MNMSDDIKLLPIEDYPARIMAQEYCTNRANIRSRTWWPSRHNHDKRSPEYVRADLIGSYIMKYYEEINK